MHHSMLVVAAHFQGISFQLIAAHAPTAKRPNEVKQEFFDKLAMWARMRDSIIGVDANARA
eukprot:6483472-Karenia_brevis.AAC.1